MNMKKLFSSCVLLAIVSLAGCVTPYQPAGQTGGYVDRKIDDQTYHVQFTGNSYTPRDKIHKYFMYRCAELTRQAGFKYFTIIPAVLSGALPPVSQAAKGTGFDPAMMKKVGVTIVPIFIYSGNGATDPSRGSADIRMFNDDAVINLKIVGFDAGEMLDQLGPYVHSEGKIAAEVPKAWVFDPGHAKVRAEDLLPTSPKKDGVPERNV